LFCLLSDRKFEVKIKKKRENNSYKYISCTLIAKQHSFYDISLAKYRGVSYFKVGLCTVVINRGKGKDIPVTGSGGP
jgi:hypothetical protein